MTPWHPWFGEVAITLRRRVPHLLLAVGLVVLTLCGLGFGWMHIAGVSVESVAGRLLTSMAHSSALATAVVAICMFVLLRVCLQAISDQLHNGWWAAMPITPRSGTMALLTIACASAATCLIVFAGLVALSGATGTVRSTAFAIVALGTSLGAGSALLLVLRGHHASKRSSSHNAIRQPLFATSWLDDRRLPHLSDWQRRLTMLRWRSHASAAMVLPVLLMIPVGGSMPGLIGLMLFTLSAGWLGVALRACIEVAAAADALLRATPTTTHKHLHAAMRYPMFAGACAAVAGLLVALAAGSWWVLLGWLALVALFLLSKVPIAWRLARTGNNSR